MVELTDEEFEKVLYHCKHDIACRGCPLSSDVNCVLSLASKTRKYIDKLQKKNAELRKKIRELRKEPDA